ncbi:MAG: ribosome assembly RNA-binding protein YhbY [Gammaproteobacteria bacterium]
MSLTESQCKHLRRLGHALKPTVLVGASGLTDSVVAEVESSLAHHELIKIRVRSGDREQRDAVIGEIVARTTAELIQRVGNMALIYRAAEEPKIVLPSPGGA